MKKKLTNADAMEALYGPPPTVHNRPVKSPRVRFVGQVEVDQGDHAMLVLEMSAEEAVGLASEQHQPDMWPIVSERLKREVVRR